MRWASWLRQVSKGILFLILASNVCAASNYVRVPLGMDASIEVPKNWVALSNNRKTTIQAYVEAKGFLHPDSILNFAANLYDDSGNVIALVNVHGYPKSPLTQDDVRALRAEDLKTLDEMLKPEVLRPLQSMGATASNWRRFERISLNGLQALRYGYRHTGVQSSGPRVVQGIRIYNAPKSFVVTLSYSEKHAFMLASIIDYMAKTVRQDN